MNNIPIKPISIDKSLNLIEKVVLYNISLYENIEDKIKFIELYYNKLLSEVFDNKHYIVETFRRKYENNIIVETKYDIHKKIEEIHTFIRKAIKFDLVSEQYAQKPEPQQPSTGPIAKKVPITKPKYDVPQISQGPITPRNVSNPTAIEKLQKMGIDSYFESIREGLQSTPGIITQFLVSLIGPGKVAVNVIWGALAIYDIYKYAAQGMKKYLSKFIADIIAIIFNLFSPSLSYLKKYKDIRLMLKGLNELQQFSFIAIIKFLVKTVGKDLVILLLPILSKSVELVLKPIENGIEWIEKELGINLGSSRISDARELVGEFADACQEYAEKDKSDGKKINTPPNNRPYNPDWSMEPGKI